MTRIDKISYFYAICSIIGRRLETLQDWEKQVMHDYYFVDLPPTAAANIINLRRNRLTDNLPK